jgi:hypothetical protein
MLGPDGAVLRDEAGKARYTPVLRWRDRDLGERWSRAVVELVRAAYPGDLGPEGAP